VQQAHTLAKLLLTDVREAVSQLREDGAIDSPRRCSRWPRTCPRWTSTWTSSAADRGRPERAHVLLRCTQEIITNAVRHAGAQNLWITRAARRMHP
jgi:signal transduction histidine kinase